MSEPTPREALPIIAAIKHLRSLVKPYMQDGVSEDWQVFIAATDELYLTVQKYVNAEVLVVLDELEENTQTHVNIDGLGRIRNVPYVAVEYITQLKQRYGGKEQE